jgi:hypothetical protein
MTEEERKKATQQISKDEKELLGIMAASLLGAGLLGGVAGYGLGYDAASTEVKPAITTIYGGQTIINDHTVRFNSSN